MEVRSNSSAPPMPSSASLGFGRVFTEHMLRMDYNGEAGWGEARIEPYQPLSLDPAAACLHYGQAVFEGLKAFRGADGVIRLFRPDAHARRFVRSCEMICIPPIPEYSFLQAVRRIVTRDAAWVPADEGSALYIRPFVFADEAFLGVRPAQKYTFLVILSPVGAYYATGFAPVRIWVERQAVRAAQGGLGGAKTAANYAASLKAAHLAKARGYDQVLWTDAKEHRWLEEVGTMNLFVHLGDEVITPPLDSGTILAGITRDSTIQLLRARGITVRERPISVDEVVEGHARGTLREVFGTGTAAVISSVGELGLPDGDLRIGDGDVGPIARSLYNEIVGIQRGTAPDPFGWTQVVG